MSANIENTSRRALVPWTPQPATIPSRVAPSKLARFQPVGIVAGVCLTTFAALSFLVPHGHGGGETEQLPDRLAPNTLADKPVATLPRAPDEEAAIPAAPQPAIAAPAAKGFVGPAAAPVPASVAVLPIPLPMPAAAPVRAAPVIERQRQPIAAQAAPARAVVASRGGESMRRAVPSMGQGLARSFAPMMRAPFPMRAFGGLFGGRMGGGFGGRGFGGFHFFRR